MTSPYHPSLPSTPEYRSDHCLFTGQLKRSTPYEAMDPLLSNLSPESTIEALTSTYQVPADERGSYAILSRSISEVSPPERALGVRAAVAAQKLGLWYKEVQTWEWPASPDAQLGKGFIPPSFDTTADSSQLAEAKYYGSLPIQLVKQYEKRIEDIRDGIESLNVEELKNYVLDAHVPSRSRPSSSNSLVSTPPPLSYVQLSDFTAVVTATILRVLPLLSHLNSLLSTWSARIFVLRQIPDLLTRLHRTRLELDTSLGSLKSSSPLHKDDATYSCSNFHARETILRAMVSSVGRRMDSILDRLEGREDSLPESWIDDVEAIESDFSAWSKDADMRATENERSRLRNLHGELHHVDILNADMINPATRPALSAPLQPVEEDSVSTTALTIVPHVKRNLPTEQLNVTPGSQILISPADWSGNAPLSVSQSPTTRDISRMPAAVKATRHENDSPLLPKRLLESPIKLHENRWRNFSSSRLPRRMSSTSADSSPSDYPSLVSSPDARYTPMVSSNGTPLCLRTPPQLQRGHEPTSHTRSYIDHAVRKDSLLRLNDHKSSLHATVVHNRTVSLPLLRFMSERLENQDDKRDSRRDSCVISERLTSADNSSKSLQSVPVRDSKCISDVSDDHRCVGREQQKFTPQGSEKHDSGLAVEDAERSGCGVENYLEGPSLVNQARQKAGLQLFAKRPRMRKDNLEERISTILSALPTPIHLISHGESQTQFLSVASVGEKSAVVSSLEELSDGLSSGAPAITLTRAAPRQRPSALRSPEESSVKVYHLHRDGKPVPTKLFIRTVGGPEGRVMVRVGGGWADLGEYLREYAAHHTSCRSVVESPRAEAQGVSLRGRLLDPVYPYAISSRPTSSLNTRKKGGCSDTSPIPCSAREKAGANSVNASVAFGSPLSASFNSTARRFSASSNASIGVVSVASDTCRPLTPSASILPPSSSTPLGLAGPKPRSRKLSISPASEAWVEDILGRARRSSSLNIYNVGSATSQQTSKLPKTRSIGDISAVESGRVALRSLSDKK